VGKSLVEEFVRKIQQCKPNKDVDDVWEWGDTCDDIYSVKEAYNNIAF